MVFSLIGKVRKRTINGSEVLSQIYQNLDQIAATKEVELPFSTSFCFNHYDFIEAKDLEQGAVCVIADDSDHHKRRVGYMRYPQAKLVEINDQTYAIGLGHSYGHYPARSYRNDLIAVEVKSDFKEPTLEEHIRGQIESSGEFIHTFVYSSDNNVLVVPRYSVYAGSFFNNKMRGYLIEEVPELVPKEKETVTPFALHDPNLKKGEYHKSMSNTILKAIEKVLRE